MIQLALMGLLKKISFPIYYYYFNFIQFCYYFLFILYFSYYFSLTCSRFFSSKPLIKERNNIHALGARMNTLRTNIEADVVLNIGELNPNVSLYFFCF